MAILPEGQRADTEARQGKKLSCASWARLALVFYLSCNPVKYFL